MIDEAVAAESGMNASRLARIPAYFQSYLDRRALPGFALLVARRGRVVLRAERGVRDWDTGVPLTPDTIFRIYSMTKPVTSVALMMLVEEGAIRLEHEVARYIPEFARLRVFDGGDADGFRTIEPKRAMRVHDLLTHTSGLSYGFLHQHPVDAIYRSRGIDEWKARGGTLADFVLALAELPLLFSPGERWNYSVSTDVCGRLVEIVSGQTLEAFFRERIFAPLGMVDTAFGIADAKLHRLATCYERPVLFSAAAAGTDTVPIRRQDGVEDSSYRGTCRFFSGGGGLLSTIDDYLRFCRMLAGGGALDGVRLLSPNTLRFMTRNHLPGNRTLAEMGDSTFAEVQTQRSGFGLGFSIVVDPVRSLAASSAGSFSWGGMASTWFWVDPVEEVIGLFMTQMIPASSYPLRAQLSTLVYAAIEN